MRILFSLLFVISITSCLAPAQSDDPIYKLPETENASSVSDSGDFSKRENPENGFMLAGSDSGLYKITSARNAIPLWTQGKVTKIIRTQDSSPDKKAEWYFLTTQGVIHSSDLEIFDMRNEGLPFLTIKEWNGTDTVFTKQPAQLKDLEVHPENPKILVTATKDDVYITFDGGLNWKSIGSTSAATSGIKAVAVCNMPARKPAEGAQTELAVFMAHTIYGFSYCYPGNAEKKPTWHDSNGGFDNMKSQTYPDEISDILPAVLTDAEGNTSTEIFVSQSYIPKLYKFDWSTKRGKIIFNGTEPADTIDGLFYDGTKLLYSRPGEVTAFNPSSNAADFVPPEYNKWRSYFNVLSKTDTLNAAWIPSSNGKAGLSLCELWLLYPDDINNKYAQKANGHKSIYIQAHKIMDKKGLDAYVKIIKDNKLDSMVIDMKDDYGGLRFDPVDPLLKEKGYVSRWKLDLDTFVPEMKKQGIYLIARIVTFKDRNLAGYDKKQYAVWDKALNRPWKGISGYQKVTDENGNDTGKTKTLYYDEDWVDPYSPEVWEYFVHVAQELVARGFDEIQFDYIRFPTDGKNLSNASFRWKSAGMDKESALLSFLSYARKNIDAPIGIDIYGANGWYRSGTRTGQDVEQLAEYVDVVCPMFYPSHFEQSFLNYAPASERPYRIYFYGTYRNTVIGRNRLIIRPWIQAFYLNVSYDRTWYNKNYVQQEIYGVRDSVDRGYMYWNGLCRYDDLSPDVGDSKYTGPSYEADGKYRKPELSGGTRAAEYPEQSISEEKVSAEGEGGAAGSAVQKFSAWDTIREQEKRGEPKFQKIGDIKKLWAAYES